MSSRLSQFSGEKYLSMETYRKTGQPVRTPVWFIERSGVFYVRTSEDTGKYKRIRNNQNIKIAPCNSRGKVKGEWVKAVARPVDENETDRVYKLLKQKYGIIYRITRMFLRGAKYVVLEIRVSEN